MKEELEKMSTSRDYASSVIENMTVALFVLTPDERIKDVNRAACSLSEYEKQELIGKNISLLILKETLPFQEEKHPLFIEGNHIRVDEIALKTKSGKEIPTLLSNSVTTDTNGYITNIICTAHDITELKKIEEAKWETEENYRILTESAIDGIYQINKSGKITFLNRVFAEIFGYKKEKLLGKHFSTLVSGRNITEVESIIKDTLTGRISKGEFTVKHKHGYKFPIYYSIMPVEKHGQTIGIAGTLKDITALKQADQTLQDIFQNLKETQEQLIQASKMTALGQLTSAISHELNQPLTGIKGFAQAMLMDMEKNNPLRSSLNKIVEQANRIDRIIQHVRFFARRSEFAMGELDINQPIEDSLMLLNEQLSVHNIRVKKSLDSNLPKIQGDPNQLEQGFLNLITNAKDAIDSLMSPDGGELIIKTSLSRDKKNIEILFEDTGCGIPKENLEHIFDPFFTTKSPEGGIGLGLSIMYRIIENHRGSIEVESEEGIRTVFTITLPVSGNQT